MSQLRWAILGTGSIAKTFARGLVKCEAGPVVSIGSRKMETATAFSGEFGGTPYDSYEAAIADPNVDAVYIALPHHMHMEATILCAKHGKHCLCEKPFTLNELEAQRALEAVEQAEIFFMEAWMYRSHPQTLKVKELVAAGAIGRLQVGHASFGYQASRGWEHFKADGAVGGGGLLDVGAYPVSFLRLMAGEEPARAEYSCEKSDTGADSFGVGLLEFPSGFRATFGCAIHQTLDNTVTLYGDEGSIHITEPWFCNGEVRLTKGGETQVVEIDQVPDLWGNQAIIMQKYLLDKESPTISKSDSLGNMKTLDMLRKSAGLEFAKETKS